MLIKIYITILFLLNFFPCTRKMQLGQTCWNIFAKVLKNYGSRSKNGQEEQIYVFKKLVFFSICSTGHPDCIFNKLAEISPPKLAEFFVDEVQKL